MLVAQIFTCSLTYLLSCIWLSVGLLLNKLAVVHETTENNFDIMVFMDGQHDDIREVYFLNPLAPENTC